MSDAQAAQVTENGVPPATQGPLVEEAPGFKVFIGNLAYSTTDEGLKTFFAPVQSDIISVQVIKRRYRPAGYGFVAVSSAEAAQTAIETLADQELDGRKVIVEIAKPADQKDKERKEKRTKWRPGRRGSRPVPGEVTEAEANGDIVKVDDTDAATPETGEAAKPKKKKKKTNRKRKAPPADAAPDADREPSAPDGHATDAPQATPKRYPRRRFRAPRPSRPVGEDPVGEPSKTMLFVANLGFNIDDEGLSALFTEAGINVISARVVRTRWGRPRRSKGYGFVDVGSEDEQQKAIEALQGKEVGGRAIAVKIALDSTACVMSDEEDYLSDKFLIDLTEATKPKTYTQRRQRALQQGRLKSLQNQTKSRRQREQESREDGLSKSLFERATQQNDAGASKALGIMMRMGFQPGQSLGKPEEIPPANVVSIPDTSESGSPAPVDSQFHSQAAKTPGGQHKAEPLPLNEWTGKKGIGLGKRPRSPSTSERIAKMAKMAEESKQESFRDRSRREYEERHAESHLVAAQRTCSNLDEKAGITFNVLWINPNIPETIPAELSNFSDSDLLASVAGGSDESTRLRNQMRADALVPLSGGYDEDEDVLERSSLEAPQEGLAPETIEEATHFLHLGPTQPRDRLNLVLTYLRDRHAYCFWCGVQYDDEEDIKQHCPGREEEDHD
ncbi:hypothetical protein V8B97DRAFT_2106924 [Scleroderma yunnanense]